MVLALNVSSVVRQGIEWLIARRVASMVRVYLLRVKNVLMQRRRVEAESITQKYYNSSTKLKFYKNTRLIGKIIEKTSLANFYSKK